MRILLEREPGSADVLKQLTALERKVSNRALFICLRDATRPLVVAMRGSVRKKSGATARSIAARALRSQGFTVGVNVGPSAAQRHVGRFLEYGYLRKNSRTGETHHVPAYPWARPSFDSTASSIATRISAGFGDLIKAITG